MNLYLTKKLKDKLKVDLLPEQAIDELYSWRANYVQGYGQRFVVFMNDASRLTIVLNNAKAAKLKKLPELFMQTLKATLLTLGINPEVVDQYISELAEITYFKNSDRTKTAWLNKCTETVWFGLRDMTDDVELSIYANKMLYGTSSNNDRKYYKPKEKIIELFGRYGLPVRKFLAVDLNVPGWFLCVNIAAT